MMKKKELSCYTFLICSLFPFLFTCVYTRLFTVLAEKFHFSRMKPFSKSIFSSAFEGCPHCITALAYLLHLLLQQKKIRIWRLTVLDIQVFPFLFKCYWFVFFSSYFFYPFFVNECNAEIRLLFMCVQTQTDTFSMFAQNQINVWIDRDMTALIVVSIRLKWTKWSNSSQFVFIWLDFVVEAHRFGKKNKHLPLFSIFLSHRTIRHGRIDFNVEFITFFRPIFVDLAFF